jgi:hypothetical protein
MALVSARLRPPHSPRMFFFPDIRQRSVSPTASPFLTLPTRHPIPPAYSPSLELPSLPSLVLASDFLFSLRLFFARVTVGIGYLPETFLQLQVLKLLWTA